MKFLQEDVITVAGISQDMAFKRAQKYLKAKFFPHELRPELWSKLVKNPSKINSTYFKEYKRVVRKKKNYGEFELIGEAVSRILANNNRVVIKEEEKRAKIEKEFIEILKVIEISYPEIGFREGMESLLLSLYKVGCDQEQTYIIAFNSIFTSDLLYSFYTHETQKVSSPLITTPSY